jgi:hypothetical protein
VERTNNSFPATPVSAISFTWLPNFTPSSASVVRGIDSRSGVVTLSLSVTLPSSVVLFWLDVLHLVGELTDPCVLGPGLLDELPSSLSLVSCSEIKNSDFRLLMFLDHHH